MLRTASRSRLGGLKSGWGNRLGASQRRKSLSYPDRFAYDVSYIDSWSLWLDLRIILATPSVVLGRDGTDERTEDLSRWLSSVLNAAAAAKAIGPIRPICPTHPEHHLATIHKRRAWFGRTAGSSPSLSLTTPISLRSTTPARSIPSCSIGA